MHVFSLLLALMLPWAAGACWVRWLLNWAGRQPAVHPAICLGYGFFVGNAVLVALLFLAASMSTPVQAWMVLAALALLTAGGALLAYRSRSGGAATACKTNAGGRPLWWRLSLYCLLLLCLSHLASAAVEQLQLPTYPWDAWLAWLYRAKAWFYSGDLQALLSRGQWLREAGGSRYSIDAYGYPPLVSALPYWVAAAWGRWSDTLVHLPYLGCGIAVALGIYGQMRESGYSALLAVLAAWLWLSLPLVDTHLSLAGYADIWMAGYAGLGFLALLVGLARGDRPQLWLGLALLALGTCVKLEGLVWLSLALALWLAATLPPRVLVAGSLALVALAALALVTGHTAVTLPVLGDLGVRDGQLYLPGMGVHRLELHNPAPAYWRGLVVGGSWNLLWPLLLCAFVSLAWMRDKRLRKPLFLFLGLFAASQVVIFAFTEQAAWATSLTAANRLPLQVSPVLVFTVLVCLARFCPDPALLGSLSRSRWLGVATVPVLAAVLILAGLYFQAAANAQREVSPPPVFTITPQQLNVVVGAGQPARHRLQLTGFNAGAAVASRSGLDLVSSDYLYLRYDIQANIFTAPRLFWRSDRNPQRMHSAELHGTGGNVISLRDLPGWNGRIIELGVVVFADAGGTASVGTLVLSPPTPGAWLRNSFTHWLAFDAWNARSINMAGRGELRDFLPLPLVVLLWLTVAVALALAAFLPLRESGALRTAILLSAVLGWLLLDVRWGANLVYLDTRAIAARQASGGEDYLPVAGDARAYALAGRVRALLAGQPLSSSRLLVLGPKKGDFVSLRAKYHLLPLPAVVGPLSLLDAKGRRRVDYLLQLSSPDRPSPGMAALQARLDAAGPPRRIRLREVMRSDAGVLYRVVYSGHG